MVAGFIVTDTSTSAVFVYLSIFIISWEILNSAILFLRRPKNVQHFGVGLGFGRSLATINFLVRANDIILDAYQKSNRSPFAVLGLRNYQVLISQPDQMQELSQAPERVLSFNAAVKDRLEHSAIMLGFKHDNKFDPDGAVIIRAVKILLRQNISNLSSIIAKRMKESFDSLLGHSLQGKGAVEVKVLEFTKAVLVKPCVQISYGDDLATNTEFVKAVLGYWWDSAYGSALCEVLPKAIARHIGGLFMVWRGSMHKVGGELESLLKERLANEEQSWQEKFCDLTQFILEASRGPGQKDPTRLRQLSIAMTFVFAHQPPMALAWTIIELGQHREYIELLREEIREVEAGGYKNVVDRLPLMESVLRETCRLHSLDALTVQRKAMEPFRFSDGMILPTGSLVAIPLQGILRDSMTYSEPDQFNPFRFNPRGTPEEAVQKWTDVNLHYPLWGSPARSCPGRWIASHLLKQFLVHFLKFYDFELVDQNKCQSVRWTTAIVPRHDVAITIRPRKL